MIDVTRKPGGAHHDGLLKFSGRVIPCKLGPGGITARKREGDGATPQGSYRILYGLYRPDRMLAPRTQLPMQPISAASGWCDAPGDPNYNRRIVLPYPASHERLFRKDRLYDICLILNCNMVPRIRNRGSAIFFHMASPERKPTAGCVAIDPAEMRLLLARISRRTILRIRL